MPSSLPMPLYIIVQLAMAFGSVLGFAVLFNCPSKSMMTSGIIGAIGWGFFLIVKGATASVISASFASALLIGLMGEFSAVRYRRPATVFIIPAILPLVPGYGLYYTMLSIIDKDYAKAAANGFEAFFIAVGISSGLLVASTLFRLIRQYQHRNPLDES